MLCVGVTGLQFLMQEMALAQGLYDITPLEPLIEAGCILLTPNSRLARHIRAEWDRQRVAAGEQVWKSLAVQSLEHWLLKQWELAVSLDLLPPLTPLAAPQALELWRQVICQAERQSPDYYLLRPAAAAELASQARDTLLRWQVALETANIRQLFELDRDCDTFRRWLNQFEQRLAATGQCTTVDCLVQLSRLSGQLPAARVVLLEFDEVAPLVLTALKALRAELIEFSATAISSERFVHPFSDKRAELQSIAIWAAELHRTSPTSSIGIVLSDMKNDKVSLEYLLRREFDCLGERYNSLPVNFSTGIALARAPLARDALRVLSMSLPYTTVPDVVDIMGSRFLDLPDAHEAVAQDFITQLYAGGREVLAVAELRSIAAAVGLEHEKELSIERHLFACSSLRNLRRNALPSAWARRFHEVLSLWGWPGTQTLDSLEYQQLQLWHRTLDEFRAYDAVCGAIDFGEALRLLHDSCSQQISQPQTAGSPVQVLGPLEAAGLAFEHLWLCGMQGTNWPAPPRPNPFIPVSLQAQLQMPHANPEREWAFGEALLRQYMRSAGTLHASWCRLVDGVPDRPSVLLDDFVLRPPPEPALIASQWSSGDRAGALERVPDQQAPVLNSIQASAVEGGSGILEDQSQCPFRAFARHRLRLAPLEDFSVTLSAGERGSLLHAALYALWGELRDQASLLALDETEQEQTVTRAVRAAIAALPQRRRQGLGSAYWRLEGQRLGGLLHEWLAVERQRSPFTVAEREQDIQLALSQLRVRLRVDRVDTLPDGSRVIIDYKSGSSRVQDWLGARPAKPQLLLYGSAEPGTAAALAFAQVQPRHCRYVGLGCVAAANGIATDIAGAVQPSMQAQDWPDLNARWQENLLRLAQAFIAGDAPVDPLAPSSCTWCGMQPLCRVHRGGEHSRAMAE